MPSITLAGSKIKKDCVLVGELCCFIENKSASHREVNAALSNPDNHDLRFAAFDLLELNGVIVEEAPIEKNTIITDLCKSKEIFSIEQHFFESRKELIEFYKSLNNEIEGMIVKASNNIIYKVKEIIHLDLVVLGYAETNNEKETWLRELLLGFCLGNNEFQLISKCGGGFSEKERKDILNQLSEISTETEYTEVSGAKTAFIMVKPEVVVEISCLDLINENSDGTIKKAKLKFDSKRGYLFASKEPALSIISPNFTRIRTDKKVNEIDCGTKQAYSIRQPLQSVTKSNNENLSEIISREVYSKSGKGGTAIRKFIGLKTNKENTGEFSPYVVVFTDYSFGRKEPLEQELFICQNEKELKSKIEELKIENIKKGWEAI